MVRPRRSADMAVYSDRLIMEILLGFSVILLILFGLTVVVLGGLFLARAVVSHGAGKSAHSAQKRAMAAKQARDLGWLAMVSGPLAGFLIALITWPAMGRKSPLDSRALATMLFLMAGLGTIAGLIAGAAFRMSSVFLGRIRKTVKRLRGGGL
jgi:hypothetical protein